MTTVFTRKRPLPEFLAGLDEEADERTQRDREKIKATVFGRAERHAPVSVGDAVESAARLADYIGLVTEDEFYWRRLAGFSKPSDVFGRIPAGFAEVRRAALARVRDLGKIEGVYRVDAREFLGRWCPVCHMQREARGGGRSKILEDIIEYVKRNGPFDRSAAFYKELSEMFNTTAVHAAANARGRAGFWSRQGAGSLDGVPPECGPEFFENHFEGGPCVKLNKRYIASMLMHSESQKFRAITKGGLYAEDGEGGVMVGRGFSSEHRHVAKSLLGYIKMYSDESLEIFGVHL